MNKKKLKNCQFYKDLMVIRFHQKHGVETIFNIQKYTPKGALFAQIWRL